MALAQTRFASAMWRKFRGKMGVRFTRFVVAAAAAFTATEVALTLCSTVFNLTSTRATLIAWFAGAVVSYVLSRWAWERKGKPDVLRETIPFWVISAMVIVILTLANKLGYHSASWMHLTGVKRALWIDFVWFVANVITFALRFVIFHFVLFTDRTTAARAAATGPDAVPPGTREAPAPGEVPAAAATEPAPAAAKTAAATPAAATPAAATPAAATPSAAKSTAGTTSMGADPA
jgi:putative flippase GtrA